MNIQDIVLGVLHFGSALIGIVGVLIIFLGVGKTVYLFLTKGSFWEMRVILVKHILLGLDFLIARDIVETVLLTSKEALWVDLVSLVIIIGIRIVFSFFAEKELDELREESEIALKKTQKTKNKKRAKQKKSKK